MSRRKRLLTLVGTVILLLSLAVPMMQCAPAAEEEVTPPPEEEVTPPPAEEEVTPPPEEGEIKYGGRLNIGFTAEMNSLNMDCSTRYTDWGCLFHFAVYDAFDRLNLPPDYYKFNPGIVQSYEVSDDRLTWTLHLVENARWHDGEPVTAEDVKFTCDHLVSLPDWADIDVCFDHVDVIDDYTVKVVNTRPITTTHSPIWWWDSIIPKHIFELYKADVEQYPNEEAIGSGPFKLKEYKTGEYMWLVVNEDYWGERPYIDEVVFKMYSTLESMLMALERGEIDALADTGLPFSLIEDFEAKPDIEVEVLPGIAFYDLSFNLHKDTSLRDKSVRKAIAYSIDRDRLIDMVFMGYGVKHDSWIYAEDPMHNPNLPQYDYDPDKANEILDEGEYIDSDADGIRNDPVTGKNLAFELLCSADDTNAVKTVTLIKEMLPDIGINVDIITTDYNTYASTIFDPEADAYEVGVFGADPSPSPYGDWVWLEATGWGSGGEWWNPSYWDNPRFNELVPLMLAAESMEERKKYLYEMQELMSEELPYVFMLRPEHIAVYRTDKFEGWVNQIGGPVSWFNAWSILEVHLK